MRWVLFALLVVVLLCAVGSAYAKARGERESTFPAQVPRIEFEVHDDTLYWYVPYDMSEDEYMKLYINPLMMLMDTFDVDTMVWAGEAQVFPPE